MLSPSVAEAHGIWGHIHVTAWAIENLPPGELRDFFEDPAVRNAAYFGAAFTDSGYWPSSNESAARAYGEHTHWEPFVEDYIQWLMANDAPPFDTQDARLRVAFLMGAAAHGLQDEIFDSYMLDFTGENDAGGQEETDPGTDGFLVMDGYTQVIPEVWIPMELLLELYEVLEIEITEDVIRRGVRTMMNVYVSNFGLSIAEGMGKSYASKIPWTRAHYMDPAIPGSLRSEINPTMFYIQAIWERLHGRFTEDDLVIHAFPEAPRRLLTGDSSSIGSVSMLIFGKGVEDRTMQATLEDDEGGLVASTTLSNQWGGGQGAFTRLVRVRPQEDLNEGEWYVSTLEAGVKLVDGGETTVSYAHRYQVECEDILDERCPDLGEIPLPVTRLSWVEEEPDEDETPLPGDGDDVEGGEGKEGNCSASSGGLAWSLAALFGLLVRRRRAKS